MRLILLALLPAALAACGDSVDPNATMPAPEPVEEADNSTPEEQPAQPQVTSEAVDGLWVMADDRGDPAARFGPEGSEAIFSVICRSSGIEGEADTLVFQRAVTEDQAGDSIDFLTSAGNARVDAVPLETDMPMVGGTMDPSSTMVATLINSTGDMRIRTGTSEIVVPTSDMFDTLLSDCRPEPSMEEPSAEGDDEATGEEEDETGDPVEGEP